MWDKLPCSVIVHKPKRPFPTVAGAPNMSASHRLEKGVPVVFLAHQGVRRKRYWFSFPQTPSLCMGYKLKNRKKDGEKEGKLQFTRPKSSPPNLEHVFQQSYLRQLCTQLPGHSFGIMAKLSLSKAISHPEWLGGMPSMTSKVEGRLVETV